MATTTAVSPQAHRPIVSERSATSGYGSPRPSSAPARARSGGRTQQGSAAPARARSGGRTQQGSAAPARARSGGRTQQGSQSPAPARSAQGAARRGLRVNRKPGPARGLGGGPSISDTNYGSVIIAEFVGVILVIALAPVAKGESQSGVSPYAGGDMVKLAGATILYVILGFVAMGGRGAARLAAWFGGLTLIAVGLAEGTVLAQEVGLFTGNLLAASQGAPSGGSPLAAGEGPAGSTAAAIGSAAEAAAAALESGGVKPQGAAGVTPNPNVGGLFPAVGPGGTYSGGSYLANAIAGAVAAAKKALGV